MLFNSYVYLLLFFPTTVFVYYGISTLRGELSQVSRWWLVGASVFFYGFWDPRYLLLILGSIGFNFLVGRRLANWTQSRKRRGLLIFGISVNLVLLGYYKYANFFAENLEALTGFSLGIGIIALPLAISFFTFQQVAFLVDSARGDRDRCTFGDYCLFVSFFPQLIAGPIVHHSEMMPQFAAASGKIDWGLVSKGLYLLGFGLFKKVIIADTLALWVAPGYVVASELTLIDSWLVTFSYSLQLYFDFSGYSDMAIGSAMILGIVLPWNFQSPYKAKTIQEFWRRWHMTLSRFLRDYIYIPLGGSRKSESRVILNLLLTFLIGGIWHGAGWTFILWGALHGSACVIHRVWSSSGRNLHPLVAWVLMLVFLNVTWVFFRAPDWEAAFDMLNAMAGLNGVALPAPLEGLLPGLAIEGEFMPGLPSKIECSIWVFVGGLIAVCAPNTFQLADRFRPTMRSAWVTAFLIGSSLLNLNKMSEFLYFQF